MAARLAFGGLALGRLALGRAFLEGLHARGLAGGHDRLGVDLGDHVGGQDDVRHAHRRADHEVADVHLEVGGDVGGAGLDGEREHLLLEHPVGPVQLERLTGEGDGDLGGDLAVGVDDLEVDVGHAAAHGVALQLAGHGEELLAVDLERQHGVEPGVGAERGPQLPGRHRHRDGGHPGAVHDGRDAAVVAQPARRAGARRAAGLGDQGEFGHGWSAPRVRRTGDPA